MKLSYKGVFKDVEQLDKGILPPNAVKFKEPENPAQLNIAASFYIIPVILLVAIFLIASYLIHGELVWGFNLLGMLLALLTLLPHEYLHAVCFGKSATVEMYVIPKQLMAFVYSTQPITKARFIFLSLLPNLVLGWIPLLIWTILPYFEYSNLLLNFSIITVTLGVGDYLNITNAIRQMPKGSMQQLSGFNSYWYIPQS
jgi:hypothetical protein